MSLEIGDTWTKRENSSIQRFLSCIFGKPQFLKIRQPSELPGVRSLHHSGMRQETRVAVLMAQLSGCTLTKWRTLNSTNLKNGETCRHLVISDGLGDKILKPKSSQTSRKIRSRKSQVKLADAEFQQRWMCRLSRGQDQIDTPQVSPQVAKKPSIKDTIWIKLDQVGSSWDLEISWKFLVCMGWNSKHLYAYRISANKFLHEQVPGIVQGTPCLALPGEPGLLDCAVDHIQLESSIFFMDLWKVKSKKMQRLDQNCVLVCQFLVFCYCWVPNCQV